MDCLRRGANEVVKPYHTPGSTKDLQPLSHAGSHQERASSMGDIRGVWARLYSHPYLLLILTMLMWGGNAVAGRLAVGKVPPMALTFLRWVVPVAILGFALRRQLLAHRQVLVARWPSAVLMGTFGFTVFNALFYL